MLESDTAPGRSAQFKQIKISSMLPWKLNSLKSKRARQAHLRLLKSNSICSSIPTFSPMGLPGKRPGKKLLKVALRAVVDYIEDAHRTRALQDKGVIMIVVVLGLYRDNGKLNGNYYNGESNRKENGK